MFLTLKHPALCHRPVAPEARGNVELLGMRDRHFKPSREPQTSRLSGELSSYLILLHNCAISVHGVLMDIYGMGVLDPKCIAVSVRLHRS